MGYSYEVRTGRLCCDSCGHAGARKVPCPHGWCQAWATCTACRPAVLARDHSTCEAQAAESRARREREQELLRQGKYLRVAALREGEKTKVWFRNSTGTERVYLMPPEAYNALPLLEPATPADFRKHGRLTPAT